MKDKIYSRHYYAGFGDSVTETYYEENGSFYCDRYVSGYWNGASKTTEVSKETIEKVIREEQDKLLEKVVELQKSLKKLKK